MAKDNPLTKPIHMNITPLKIEEFVEKLAKDDAFRSEMQNNTLVTLQSYGIEVAADQLFSPVVLPPKSELLAALEKIKKSREADIVFFMGFLGLVFKPAPMPHPK